MPLSRKRGFKVGASSLELKSLDIGELFHTERSPSTSYSRGKHLLRLRGELHEPTMPKHISILLPSFLISNPSVFEVEVAGVQVLSAELGTSSASRELGDESQGTGEGSCARVISSR
jgi:hypothetical protein